MRLNAGGTMTIGISILVIAFGAALRFATGIYTIGSILMLVGGAGLLLGLALLALLRHHAHQEAAARERRRPPQSFH